MIHIQAYKKAVLLLKNKYGQDTKIEDYQILQIQSDLPSTIAHDRLIKKGEGKSFIYQARNTDYKIYIFKK
jgi:hypothetical protein